MKSEELSLVPRQEVEWLILDRSDVMSWRTSSTIFPWKTKYAERSPTHPSWFSKVTLKSSMRVSISSALCCSLSHVYAQRWNTEANCPELPISRAGCNIITNWPCFKKVIFSLGAAPHKAICVAAGTVASTFSHPHVLWWRHILPPCLWSVPSCVGWTCPWVTAWWIAVKQLVQKKLQLISALLESNLYFT